MNALELLKQAVPMVKEGKELIKGVSQMYGIVHKREEAEINGVRGFLIWDYIVWNEITFQTMDGKIFSFFNSRSDKETEKEWNKLVEKYGK